MYYFYHIDTTLTIDPTQATSSPTISTQGLPLHILTNLFVHCIYSTDWSYCFFTINTNNNFCCYYISSVETVEEKKVSQPIIIYLIMTLSWKK